jgi:hypothetical protein
MPLTVSESAELIETSMRGLQLLQLDDLWTAHAVGGNPTTSDNFLPDLGNVVNSMHELIESVSRDMYFVADLYKQNHHEANAVMSELVWGSTLPPDTRDDLRWWVDSHGGLDAMFESARRTLESTNDEHELLQNQYNRLQQGLPALGDLSKSFRCSTAAQLLAGGVLAAQGGVAGGIVAGATAGVFAGAAVGATGGLGGIAIIGFAVWWAKRHRC